MRIAPVALVSVDEQGNICVYNVNEKKGFFGRVSELMPQMVDKIMDARSGKPKE
jgi:uncharacterized spore protein YtfJ